MERLFESPNFIFDQLNEQTWVHFIEVQRSNHYYWSFFNDDAQFNTHRFLRTWREYRSVMIGVTRKSDGFRIGMIDTIPNHPKYGVPHISLLTIHARYHGHGYGQKILYLFINYMEWKRVGIHVLAINTPAMKFWKQQGFQTISSEYVKTCQGMQELIHMEREF
ncbi:GNAT family N-acetyltransferase [Baia soyae]|uniref:Acetyltransferase (GNAT) family protein n=1 Tax=Baia soyae TaxID=1544746 RepID=A0A4R2RZZ2_9BACL|nr:GNAT family N-acetyltransferase [Baia soyae]TCP70667.1 acetyltransferase (GNAT) family protein [Baia soyae]